MYFKFPHNFFSNYETRGMTKILAKMSGAKNLIDPVQKNSRLPHMLNIKFLSCFSQSAMSTLCMVGWGLTLSKLPGDSNGSQDSEHESLREN